MTQEHDEPGDKAYLQEMGRLLKAMLPEGHGFILLAFPFGEGEGRTTYVSNARREDAVNALKEWLLKAGAAEDWMKHRATEGEAVTPFIPAGVQLKHLDEDSLGRLLKAAEADDPQFGCCHVRAEDGYFCPRKRDEHGGEDHPYLPLSALLSEVTGIADSAQLLIALRESLKLQSHYANLLNMWDGGERIGFDGPEAWMARLRETGTLPKRKEEK